MLNKESMFASNNIVQKQKITLELNHSKNSHNHFNLYHSLYHENYAKLNGLFLNERNNIVYKDGFSFIAYLEILNKIQH